jgi:hypothetical protein
MIKMLVVLKALVSLRLAFVAVAVKFVSQERWLARTAMNGNSLRAIFMVVKKSSQLLLQTKSSLRVAH